MNYVSRKHGLCHAVDVSQLPSVEPNSFAHLNGLGIAHDDIKDIFIPLAAMIWRRYQCWHSNFPMIIGVTGAASVGKSIFTEVLFTLLTSWCERGEVSCFTTDNFLFSSHALESMGLRHHKGFPESFDQTAMQQCLSDIRVGHSVIIPDNDHKLGGRRLNLCQQIDHPNIVLVEGVNAIYFGHYSSQVDIGIFLEAPLEAIKCWFLKRLKSFIGTSCCDSSSYFHALKGLYPEQMDEYLSRVWEEVELENYHLNILSQRDSADWVIDKKCDHAIKGLWLKG
ncbi:MAG: hypothetical protein CL816_06880 [Coxiellaceae bacterium]|nr:hypothetical protein [Coxiellaceae bacterium]